MGAVGGAVGLGGGGHVVQDLHGVDAAQGRQWGKAIMHTIAAAMSALVSLTCAFLAVTGAVFTFGESMALLEPAADMAECMRSQMGKAKAAWRGYTQVSR